MYMQGWLKGLRPMQSVIWIYSISRKSWSSLHPPQEVEISSGNYTIAEYQSQLLIVGGLSFKVPRGKEWNRSIYKLDQVSLPNWEVRKDLQIPDDLITPHDMSATSYDSYLIITWVKDNTLQLLIHFNGQGWESINGPKCTRGHCIPGVFFLQRMLYMSENGFLHRIALKSLHTSRYSDDAWETFPSIPERNTISNFAVISSLSRPLIMVVISRTLLKGFFYAFKPDSKNWIPLEEVTFYTMYSPVVVGLQREPAQDARMLLMGRIKEVQDHPSFGMLEVTATGKFGGILDLHNYCLLSLNGITQS